MAVYLLKYRQAAGDPDRPRASALYYVGYAEDEHLPRRLRAHRHRIWEGEGGGHQAKLPKWFRLQGIGFRCVRVFWGFTREDERRIKKGGHYERYDPRAGSREPAWVRARQAELRRKAHRLARRERRAAA